jgi:Ca-activated chloride channel family protein
MDTLLPTIDLSELEFGARDYLWLLLIPALLLLLWVWRFAQRRADAQRLTRARVVPVRERFALFGDLPFWLSLIVALAFVILALARPHGPATIVRKGGIDMVILADASASMRVKDVAGDRWQRAMRFVRGLGDALSWKDDRIALAIFAHIAAPQVRLTKDPNTFFFFLDHLDERPPFRIEEDTTWDTNMELGLYWGLRVIERDEELHGKSSNAKMFVLLSDGQAWSGEVEKAIKLANDRRVPIFVIGVGTLGGGAMPELRADNGEIIHDPDVPTSSRLDREALQRIAMSGGGQYFELDRDGDRHIANAIIDAGKRMAPSLGESEEVEELYWFCLVAAAAAAGFGLLFLRERGDLWIQVAGATAILVGVFSILQ